MILFVDNEGPDQTAQMCSVIWAFGVSDRQTLFAYAWRYVFTWGSQIYYMLTNMQLQLYFPAKKNWFFFLFLH